jgi:hypothetical protein
MVVLLDFMFDRARLVDCAREDWLMHYDATVGAPKRGSGRVYRGRHPWEQSAGRCSRLW